MKLISIKFNKNYAATILLSLQTFSQYFPTIWLLLNEWSNTSHNLNLSNRTVSFSQAEIDHVQTVYFAML